MVLQARYKAEEVWYAVVGEKEKELPNVVDYNIKTEITKDTSAVENANNDTTTGMADVIPWVNTPKLIADTSIIGWWLKVSTASANKSMTGGSNAAIDWYTISSNGWDIYIDDAHPARIYSASWWTYMVGINLYTSNANASLDCLFYGRKSDGTITYRDNFYISWWLSNQETHTAVVTVEPWWYFMLYITLWVTETAHCVMTFIKLA